MKGLVERTIDRFNTGSFHNDPLKLASVDQVEGKLQAFLL